MDVFAEFIAGIGDLANRERTEEVLNWVQTNYPNLEKRSKMESTELSDHGTYIIGFSVSKKHLAVAPESVGITHVEEDIKRAGYDYTKEIIRIPWDKPVDYELLAKMIEFNIWDKKNTKTFWR